MEQPKYYVDIENPAPSNVPHVVVRSVATGAEIGRVPDPVVPHQPVMPVDVAVAPDDVTFYAEYDVGNQTCVYSFSLTASGSLTPMTLVKGGVVHGADYLLNLVNLAVSPDGTKIALTFDSTNAAYPGMTGVADKIAVIDLRTGAQSIWQGGLYRPDKNLFSIQGLSWADGGRSLVFLPTWCPAVPNLGAGNQQCAINDTRSRDSEVRSLNVASGGGSLADSSVLLRGPTANLDMEQMVADQDGNIDALVLDGPKNSQGQPLGVSVFQVSAADGAVKSFLYQRIFVLPGKVTQTMEGYFLGSDSSGRYVLLGVSYTDSGGGIEKVFRSVGWLDHHAFHALPTVKGFASLAW